MGLEDAEEPGTRDWRGAENFVEEFCSPGGGVGERAESADAVEGGGVVVGRGCRGEDCSRDVAVTAEMEELRIEFVWGCEERDVQINVGDGWRWVDRGGGECEICELERSGKDDGVVGGGLDFSRRRMSFDGVGAVG